MISPDSIVRSEGAPRTRDEFVNEACEGTGRSYDFFRRVYGGRSVEDRALRLDGAFRRRLQQRALERAADDLRRRRWEVFRRFTSQLDVIAHELTHGVSQYTAGFSISGQLGALSEHFSDVFGVVTKQYWLRQTAARADWLVGATLFTSRVNGDAIRSLKSPGSAFDDPILGRDPQPVHMRGDVRTAGDDRGVHINSGIPNHAFYRAATLLGGRAWEVAGRIWYRALTRELSPRAQFQ